MALVLYYYLKSARFESNQAVPPGPPGRLFNIMEYFTQEKIYLFNPFDIPGIVCTIGTMQSIIVFAILI